MYVVTFVCEVIQHIILFQLCGHGIDDGTSIYTQYSEDSNLSMYILFIKDNLFLVSYN